MPEPTHDPWDDHATWWQTEFTEGVDPEYTEQIIPMVVRALPPGKVLDVGAGEGQVSRHVDDVVCLDPSWAQVSVGAERGGSWLQGSATALPVADSTFDVAIACLVFEHIGDLDAAISEVARVLKPGGTFLLLLNHPLLQTPDSGWIDDHILMEQYWRIGEYLPEAETVEEVQKDVFITFFHRPLGRYLNALIEHGFELRRFDEPPPPKGFLDQAPEYTEAAAIPRLLFLELRLA